jgi:hypothetical protein
MSQLKLIALDEQDLQVISAHVQDAVTKVADLSFLAGERRFVVVINRFVWEKKRGFFGGKPERRRSVLHFEGVSGVRSAGFSRDAQDDVLSILALRFEPAAAPAGSIEITCAGDAAIRLDVDYIESRLSDLGAAWETTSQPRHGV